MKQETKKQNYCNTTNSVLYFPLVLTLTFFVSCFVIFFSLISTVNAETLYVQHNGSNNEGQAFGYLGVYVNSSAQFYATDNFVLNIVEYSMQKNNLPTGDVVCSIMNTDGSGVPTTVIAESNMTLDASTLSPPYAFRNFTFTSGDVVLTKDESYAIVFRLINQALDENNFMQMEYDHTGTFYLAYYNGVTWNPYDTTSVGNFRVWGTLPVATSSVTGYLINKTRVQYNLSDMNINNLFNGKANYSVDGVTNPSGVCEWNTSNINTIHSDTTTSNYTLSGGTPLNFSLTESIIGVINEDINFRICRLLTPKRDVLIRVNNTLIKTVTSDIIPLCSIGFHEEENLRTTNIGFNETISISCPTCALNHMRIIKQDTRLIRVKRLYSSQNESMTYNTTDGFYYDTDIDEDSYSFPPGNNDITFTCNGTSTSITAQVKGIIPTATLLSLAYNNVEKSFINGTITESSSILNVTGECFGDVINFTQINVTNSTGTLIKSVNREFINLSSTDLIKDGNYTVHFLCVNQFGNSSTDTRFFEVKDTINPSITWNNPKNDNNTQETVNFLFQIDVDVYDINLYAYNLLVKDPANNIIINQTKLDLNTTSEKVIGTYTPNITGTYTATMTVSDDHTTRTIPDYDYAVLDDSYIQFNITETKGKIKKVKGSINIDYVSGIDRTIEIIKEPDRYKWKYNFLGDTSGITTHKIKVSCPGISYREYSDYPAHFVCPETNNWIDFVSSDIIEYDIKENGKDKYEVSFKTDNKRSVQMESIGGLNIVSEQISFNVVEASTSTNTTLLINECPGTVEGVGVLFIIFLIVVCFVIVALMTDKGILYILAGASMLVFSWTIYGCQEWFGAFLGVSSMFLILYAMTKKPT